MDRVIEKKTWTKTRIIWAGAAVFGVLLLVLARLILFGPTRVHRCNLRVMVRLSLGGVAYFYRSLNVLRDLVLLAV